MNNNPVQSFREQERSVPDFSSCSQPGIERGIGNRELFHHLMHVEDYPDALLSARLEIESLLSSVIESKASADIQSKC